MGGGEEDVRQCRLQCADHVYWALDVGPFGQCGSVTIQHAYAGCLQGAKGLQVHGSAVLYTDLMQACVHPTLTFKSEM